MSSLTALIRVDNITYSLLGPVAADAHGGQCPNSFAIQPMPQDGPSRILPTSTTTSYYAVLPDESMCHVALTFSQPLLMEDFDSFKPFANVVFNVTITNATVAHNVSIFFEMTGQHAVDNDSATVVSSEFG